MTTDYLIEEPITCNNKQYTLRALKLNSKRIVWIDTSSDIKKASFRIRCLYIAYALNKYFGYENYLANNIDDARKLIKEGCHLIFIKSWWKYIDLAYEAKDIGCTIYLDICDNILDKSYKDNIYNSAHHQLIHFLENFDKIIVPTASIASKITKGINYDFTANQGKIVICPDVAESRSELINAISYLNSKVINNSNNELLEIIESLSAIKKTRESQDILWFGNSYSPTSNMGIASLIPHLKTLKKVCTENNSRLVLCTNSNANTSILDTYSINYTKKDWTITSIYEEIANASVVLLTTGNDARCDTKSNNRILFSLVNECPVISLQMPNSSELNDVVIRSLKEGINRYICDQNAAQNKLIDLDNASNVLERFSPQSISSIYDLVLQNSHLQSNIISMSNPLGKLQDKPAPIPPECDMPENIPARNMPSNINTEDLDLLLVCGKEGKNWILDGIAKEIGSRSKLKWAIYYNEKNPQFLPKARNIMFMHQALMLKFFRKNLLPNNSKLFCWYTHPRDETDKVISEQLKCFNLCYFTVFACSMHRDLWISRGLSISRSMVLLGGYDPRLFSPSKRRMENCIGICSAFHERKNPRLIHQIVKEMRDTRFLLIGKGWEKYSLYEALINLGNIEYVSPSYKEYPYYYAKMNVFLSTSLIEGGPIPLIEAMACNRFPVVSDTGFARDLITNGENGFLFPINSDAHSVCSLLRNAMHNTHLDISGTVDQYTWNHFSDALCKHMN